MNKISLNL